MFRGIFALVTVSDCQAISSGIKCSHLQPIAKNRWTLETISLKSMLSSVFLDASESLHDHAVARE